MKAVLIPAKRISGAKQRLAAALSLQQRTDLIWAMLGDVTAAVNGATVPDRIVLISSDPEILGYAGAHGWEAIEEKAQVSESQSVDHASTILKEEGVGVVLRIPLDVPLIRSQDVDQLLGADAESPNALLVPSRDGQGTNALLRCPPDAFPSRFGPGSLAHHRREAARAGVSLTIVENVRVALDLDEVVDLNDFRSLGANTATGRYLAENRILARKAH